MNWKVGDQVVESTCNGYKEPTTVVEVTQGTVCLANGAVYLHNGRAWGRNQKWSGSYLYRLEDTPLRGGQK